MLTRALTADARRYGVEAEVVARSARRWSSATFTGARHELTITATTGVDADRWLASLPEADLPLRGHLVADLAVIETSVAENMLRARIEALTVEER